ncbi:MAG: sulfatase [Phycisphaerales bacterium]|nr:sulfatase [Phycisphaerales bacterium]
MSRIPIILLALVAVASAAQASERPPNVVIVFVDDLGYGDLGCYGAPVHRTPNIDRLASEGVRFTDFYVAQPVCSSSRAALLTGCYPNRLGLGGVALSPGAKRGIADAERTLAELCRDHGYATAVFGKWHLGDAAPFRPLRHGFDTWLGIPYSNDMWPGHPETPKNWPPLPLYRDDAVVDAEVTAADQSRFTRDFTDAAVSFIEAHRASPFLVYLAHPMPHVPLYPGEAFVGHSASGTYGDVVEEIDWSVGRILATIARLGLDDDTIVMFISDNGPWLSYGNHAGTTGPLREGKGTTFDGGVRVPCVVRWPGGFGAGLVCHEPAMTIDILPTIAALLGDDSGPPVDGVDIRPLLTTPGATIEREALYFYYGANRLEAVRSGRWKLHLEHTYRSMIGREPGHDGRPGQYDYGVRIGVSLFDLASDPGEQWDLASRRPDVVERMMRLVERARADLGDDAVAAPGTGRREPGRIE